MKDKDLLLKDLSARFPYGVKLHIPSFSDTPQLLQQISNYGTVIINDYTSPISIDKVKPYLRPISSMTEEEKKTEKAYKALFKDSVGFIEEGVAALTDFYNSHHLDYRDMIGKRLALPAKKGMYDNKNNNYDTGRVNCILETESEDRIG